MAAVRAIPLGRLDPHPANVRKDLGDVFELAASIREQGVLQPLLVVPNPRAEGRFYVIDGHRRRKACELLRMTDVPGIIRTDNPKAIEVMLTTAVQREGLTPTEEAAAYQRMIDHAGMTRAEVAKRIGKSVGYVERRLLIGTLPDRVLEEVDSHALPLQKAADLARQVRATNRGSVGVHVRPQHFGAAHPLVKQAQARCRHHQGTSPTRTMSSACGECWEAAIRADERTKATSVDA